MAEAKVRHLPVAEEGKRLAGLVTRERLSISPADLGSLNVWEISRFLSSMKVKDVMVKQKDVITIGPDAPLEDAAQVMVMNKIGGLPVLEEGIIVGILTDTDMLVQLVTLLGGRVPGVRATIRVPDRVGEFAKITRVIASQGWGIYTSGSVPTPRRPGYWDIVIKMRGVPKDKLIKVLKQVEDQEIVDVREV
jgi:acetoin utilization protein AcuB